MVMKKTLVILILSVALLVIVWHRSVFADTTQSVATTQQIFCPQINDLKQNSSKGTWEAQMQVGPTTQIGSTMKTQTVSWKSYDRSFATNITKFIGAQWTGADVGQLTCIYNSEQTFTMEGKPSVQPTLPILLVFHTLTFQPTIEKTARWKHVSYGVYNCYSFKQSDCPYKMNVKQSAGNIYQEAEALKKD